MKKFWMVLTAMVLTMTALARPVDPAQARRVAEVYLQSRGMKHTAALVDMSGETPFSEFYVFAAPQGGFILVSGDDCVIPVLGYSTTTVFLTKDIPDHIRGWYDAYEHEIRRIRAIVAEGRCQKSEEVAQQWQLLQAGEMVPEPLTAVSPLLTTMWDQSPYYNNLCPYHSASDERSVTGCVATATAQVMKYYNHPATGYGSHTYTSDRTINGVNYNFPDLTADFGSTTYQWSLMPNSLSGTSSSAQVNAVATLMYHIGVADEMSYSPVASGAHNYNTNGTISRSSQTSLMKFFKYRPDMAPLARADYNDAAYAALLRAEIDQQRPVLYSGSNVSAGHSFVFDGYDNSGNIHVNWGWGGYHDGYFAMGSLNPGVGGIGGNSSGTYNMDNVALIGIRPNTNWSTSGMTTVTATSTGYGTVSGGGSYAFGDTVALKATPASGYRFAGWSDGSKFNPREIIATGGSYTFTATFEAVTGDTLHYCPGNYKINNYGATSGACTWGIRLPSPLLTEVDSLVAVQLFVADAGTYNLTIYTGATHSVTAATATVAFTAADEQQWKTITLATPVVANYDIWIVFSSSNAGYPASYTYGSGVAGAFLWGSNLNQCGVTWDVTAMIKGIFKNATVAPPTQYTLTAVSNNTSWGSVSGGGTYTAGATATLTATPAAGYQFVQWQDGNTDNPRTVTVNDDATYTATFEAIPPETFTLTVVSADPTMGSVEGSGTYDVGMQVSISAYPASGYRFTLWHDGNTDNPRTVTVTTDITYTAYFAPLEGIGEVENDGLVIAVNGRTIRVEGGQAAYYDMLGRRLGSGSELTVAAAGVYLVRVGTAAYKVVIK